MDKYDIFISYSRKDIAIADKICEALDKYGITYFIDRQGIAGGMEFPMVLADAIIDSRLFLFLASRNSYDSKFTNSEITFAFNEKSRQSILPYIIDGSELPRHFRFIFSGINWRNIGQHPIDPVLIDDLCTLLGRKKTAVAESQKENAPSQDQINEWAERGYKYYSEGNYNEAAKWFRLAAEQGDAYAQYNLGVMYDNGNGVERNRVEAAKWYRLAAEQGYAEAQVNLGLLYKNGKGVEKNHVEALKWYRLAAEQRLADAQYNLGQMYEYGYGVEINKVEAMKWARLAAEQGHVRAQRYLGREYSSSYPSKPDYVEAAKWYKLAAEQGDVEAQIQLGYLFRFGYGVERDLKEAVKWYRLAAEQGDACAKEALKRLNAN